MAIDKEELKGKSKGLLIYMIEVLEASRKSLVRRVEEREKQLSQVLPLPLGRDGKPISIGSALVREDGTNWECIGILYKKGKGAQVMVRTLETDVIYARSLIPQFLPPKQFSQAKRKKTNGD